MRKRQDIGDPPGIPAPPTAPRGISSDEYERGRREEREACAAYCLDRADQYDTNSGTWPALAEAAEGIAKGDAAGMMSRGETEDLIARIRKMSGFTRPTPKPRDRPRNRTPLTKDRIG